MGAAYAAITESDNWFVGDDFTLRFTVRDEETEAIIDVTGWDFSWQLRADPNEDDPAILTKTNPAFRDDPNGIVEIDIPRTDTENLRPGKYHHALARTNSGSYWHLSEGPATLRPAVAR